MSSSSHEIPTLEKIASEARTYVFDFSRFAEVIAGDTLSTPTASVTPSGPTLGSPSLTVAVIQGIPVGKGVQFSISGGTAGTTYAVTCLCTTAGGATLARRMNLQVI